MANILVTDGEQRAALAVVRALGDAGHTVAVASASGKSLAGASRRTKADFRVPNPLTEPAAYIPALEEAARWFAADVIVPITEPAVIEVGAHAERFRPAIIPFPPVRIFKRISDKVEVARIAAGIGIQVPQQVVLSEPGTPVLPEWAAQGAVLKPSRSVHGGVKLAVTYLEPGDDPIAKVASLPEAAFPLLVQQRISGPGEGVFLLRWEGRTLAAFAHERIREKPPSGGVSVLRKSVPIAADLLTQSERLLDAFDWNGVAMIEYKRSTGDGQLYIMEINGRFWGSLQLAIDSGVDFPVILLKAALGEHPDAVTQYKVDVRSRWLLGDVDHLLARLLGTRQSLHLPLDAPSRARVIAEFLRGFLPPNRNEVLRLDDPKPFVREVLQWVRSAG